jgi:hypothetical protein
MPSVGTGISPSKQPCPLEEFRRGFRNGDVIIESSYLIEHAKLGYGTSSMLSIHTHRVALHSRRNMRENAGQPVVHEQDCRKFSQELQSGS